VGQEEEDSMNRTEHANRSTLLTRRQLSNPWLVLVAVAVGMMMESMDTTVVTVANPSISESMNANLLHLQWLTNGYMFAQAVLLIAAGRVGDRFRHRRVFFIGMTGFVVASVLVAGATTINQMIAFRLLQGAFSAVLVPSSLGILREVFPPNKLQVAIGVFMSVFVVGGILGPIVGGVLTDFASWRWIFLINLPIGAAAIALGALTIPWSPLDGEPHPLDIPGIALLTAALLGLVLGVSQGPYQGWTSAFCLSSFAVAVVAGVGFALRERATDAPVLPLAIFRQPSVSAAVLLNLIVVGLAFASWFYLLLYLQQVQGYRPVQAGLFLLPVTVMFVVAAPVGGGLNKRFGPRAPILTGIILIAVGLFGLSRISQDSSYHSIWPFLAATGLGVGFLAPAATEVVVSNAPRAMAGVASGVAQTALICGNVLAIATAGTLISARVAATLPGHLAGAGVPGPLQDRLGDMVGEVAEGRVVVPPDTPAGVVQAVTAGAHAAFVDGLRTTLLVASLVVAACLLLVPLVRRPTVHEPIPEQIPEPAGHRQA
jgi:EmrB/QacA subfamily drug resistance transporter